MNIKDYFFIIFLLLFSSLYLVLAWQEPSYSPPGGSGAISVDSSGNVVINNNLNVSGRLNVNNLSNFQGSINVLDHLIVGTSTNPKGILLFTRPTGTPYCLYVYTSGGSPYIGLQAGGCW